MPQAQTAGPIPEAPADEEVEGVERHPDDEAVDRFAVAMKAKLAQKRAEGRGGWENKDECGQGYLSELLAEHVRKGDPVDVANLAMMLHQRGERINAIRALSVSPLTEEQPVGEAGPMPGTTGFTMAAFKAADVPVGTKLYVAPVPHTARPIDTDDQVEELAKECGINNRRFMTPGDYSIWCRQQRQFARLAALPRSTTGGAK